MKKRKKPYVLVAVLVLALGGAAAWNLKDIAASDAKSQHSANDGHDHNEPVTGESRAPEQASEIAGEIKSRPNPGPSMVPPDAKGGPGPSLVREPPKKYTPQPSDSQISGQWWSEVAPTEYKKK